MLCIACCDASSPGLDHLVFLGEVDPKLKAPQIAFRHLGHFTVHNAPPCCHPLHSSWPYHALQPLSLIGIVVIPSESILGSPACTMPCPAPIQWTPLGPKMHGGS